MAVKHIYTCDKCGNEQTSAEQFWTIGVTAKHGLYTADKFVKDMSLQVCRPCLEGFGIYVQKRPEQEQSQPQPPTLEELIREIVQRCS